MAETLQSLASTLQAQIETKKDYVADTRRFSLTPDPSGAFASLDLPTGVNDFQISEHAHHQIAGHLDIPTKTYDRLLDNHSDLLAYLANGLLSREPSKRLIRTMDGKVRAFLSDRYRPRDNWDLLEHLLPVLNDFPGFEFKQATLTDTRMYLKLFLPSLSVQVTPKVGDVIRGGVIVSNSEVGAGSLYIYPYTDRLICLNGMVHTDFGQRRVHLGKRIEAGEEAFEFYSDATLKLDDQAFFAKCADTLRGCLNEAVFEAIAGQMRDLAGITIPGSPVDAVEEIAKKQGFNEDEKDSVLRHIIEGGDLSGWGFLNGITAMARDLDDADRQTQVEMIAGRMCSDPTWAGVAA